MKKQHEREGMRSVRESQAETSESCNYNQKIHFRLRKRPIVGQGFRAGQVTFVDSRHFQRRNSGFSSHLQTTSTSAPIGPPGDAVQCGLGCSTRCVPGGERIWIVTTTAGIK